MGKESKRRCRQRCYGTIDDDEMFCAMEEGQHLELSYTKMFFVMMFLIILMYLPGLSEREKSERVEAEPSFIRRQDRFEAFGLSVSESISIDARIVLQIAQNS